jgi:hypothetical protein
LPYFKAHVEQFFHSLVEIKPDALGPHISLQNSPNHHTTHTK